MKSLAASFVAMLFVDTIGAIDPFGPGKVFLPSPRRYLATFLLWGLLGIVSGFGPNAARVSGRLAGVVLLAAAVLGPFGKKFLAFVQGAAAVTAPLAQEATS